MGATVMSMSQILARMKSSMWMLALVGFCATSAAADLLLFRGDFIYVIPREVSDEMVGFAARGEWKHFPEHTRFVDADGDGERDFVAVAFGATSGHGTQLRYRLRLDEQGELKLGRWYWAAVLAPDGARVFEEFNP